MILQASKRRLRDSSWIRQAFLVNDADNLLDDLDRRNRTFTTARFKFMDTTLGGHIAINPPPQFTRNADLKVQDIFTAASRDGRPVESTASYGMGRAWSETFDDNMRIVTFRWGVPEFNSLTTFFTGFYNSSASSLARTGRAPGLMFTAGQVLGYAVTILALPILIVNFFGNLWRVLDQRPASKYYYLKPAMPLYWNAVSSIVNNLAVNSGLIPRVMGPQGSDRMKDNRYVYSKQDLENFKRLLPDLIMEDGGINVYAMATRAQRLSRKFNLAMEDRFKQLQSQGQFSDALNQIYNDGLRIDMASNSSPSFLAHLNKWFATAGSKPRSPGDGKTDATNTQTTKDSAASTTQGIETGTENMPKAAPDIDGLGSFLEAELDDGSHFVSFCVEEVGPVSESFSSSTADSEIANKINSMSSESRSTRFSFAGGNLGNGAIASTVEGIMGGVKNFAMGVAEGVGASGLAALGGSAFVDIPQYWQDSTANLPSMSYSFTLNTPYGDPMSVLLNLYVPLAMILAGALPLSTGKQSYTSPLLCEFYDRGRAQTRLGIIDSLTIERGTGNLGFTASGTPLSIRVTFTVKSLSTVMHMPIVQGFSLTSPLEGLMDEDTAFSDYMNTLSAVTLAEQVYTGERLKLALTRKLQNMRTWFSKAHTAQFVGSWGVSRLASIFYTGTINR